MAENNMTTASDLGLLTRSIDLVERFTYSIEELLEILGITRRLPLDSEAIIKTYKWDVTTPSSQVGEGETIPLTNVKRTPGPTYEVPFNKYRKSTTAEAIRRHGIDIAIDQADEKMLQEIQQKVVASFYTFLSTAPTKHSETSFQRALSIGKAKAETFFPGAPPMISFVNSMDVANWLGDRPVNAIPSTGYGFQLLTDFLDQRVLVFKGIPQGKVYSTAVENIIFANQDVRGNDLARAFNLTTDPSGLIGLTHSAPRTDNATIETLAFQGSTLFAEILDGVVETTIATVPEIPEG